MTKIIAITGTLGSGKSTTIRQICERHPHFFPVHEDDYQTMTDISLTDLESWWRRGANLEEFDLTLLAEVLKGRKYRSQTSSIESHQVTLLESQFGRCHPQLAPLVDYQIWLKVPPDIGITRKIAQHCREALWLEEQGESNAVSALHWLTNYCDSYATSINRFISHQNSLLAEQSDYQLVNQTPDSLIADLNLCFTKWGLIR